MLRKFWFWLKKVYKNIRRVFSPSAATPNVTDVQTSIEIINDKIKLIKGTNKNKINVVAYQKYFNFLEKLGLREDFWVITAYDELMLDVTLIRPLLINKNNNKVIIFCHGLTNNRWSLFYTMHLALQRGYQVVSYDVRNHGLSGKSATTLGQIEACDLQDIITWVKEKYRPEKIGLYGFSMGAATLIFWTSYFAGAANSEVAFAICEAPFDQFSTQLERALGSGINYYWKHFFLKKLVKETLHSSQEKLERINPYLVLPQNLPIKLLLLHGLQDAVIGWQASFRLHYQLSKNKLNKNKINLYLCRYADHGEFPFLGDYIPDSLRWKKRKKHSKYTFTGLFCNYLEKNL
ncbi:Putative hydrolase [endosymbiont DhMRE of Dentiscutata heterogama]|uniref:alpha/beta hydrolase family protein n=1 Tax=endosymbiont DhMRE of Dentiscutata heterogama TaxID=1609546 RepID=UPI000629D707|nr:alpha/beta fold hydrolase [endosymbiont DhMRE of Dentiscutata heterogama]CFW92793.1 Putative hydrolase [endosymbiont DhMRE of Dentiscutata heterogama]